MKHTLSHFAIYIDDLSRASDFYKKVFNWSFNSYGGPDFAQIKTGDSEEDELIGALQHRKYQLTADKVIGFECSIAVEDVDQIAEMVQASGGKILMPKTEIPHVGWIIKFEDTEGNIVCAMQYAKQQKG